MIDITEVIRQSRAYFCVDCGKCTAVCPVNHYDPQFSPRLIVQKALRDKYKAYSDPKIWSCIGCNMCMIRCNYSVSYVDMIRHLRMKSRENGTEPLYSHGCVTEAVMHLMGNEKIKQVRNDWIPSDIQIDGSCKSAFFVGCAPYFDIIFQELNVHLTAGVVGAMRLLNHAGVPFTVLDNERCCGHDLILAGDLKGFLKLGKANHEELKMRGVEKIITACPECYYTFKMDYPKYIEGWDLQIVHLAELPEIHTIKGKANSMRATYHDPCTLGRGLKIYDAPRKLLTDVAGMEIVEMENNHENSLCCGASPWIFCGAVNKQIQDERLGQAKSTGVDQLVTSCPKCLIHLTCAARFSNGKYDDLKIVDLYQLVGQSLARKENT